MDIVLIILLLIFTLLMVTDFIVENKRNQLYFDIMENYSKLINVQWNLEQIVIDAEVKKELPFMTVEKIKKELFPSNKSDK